MPKTLASNNTEYVEFIELSKISLKGDQFELYIRRDGHPEYLYYDTLEDICNDWQTYDPISQATDFIETVRDKLQELVDAIGKSIKNWSKGDEKDL